MLELTPYDILHKDWMELDPDDEPFCVYAIFEDPITIYVGKSTSVFNRIEEHFNPFSSRGNYQLQAIARTFPDVLKNWKVRFYTIEDCRIHLLSTGKEITRLTARSAEIAMIQALSPYLNSTYNIDVRSQLPERYQRIFNNLDDNAVDKLSFLARGD